MIEYPYGALYTGAALIIGSAALIIRHYLLGKSNNYPEAPKFLLNCEWTYAMFIAFAGLYYISVFIYGKPDTIPPQPAPLEQVMATAVALRELVLMLNIARQRLPKEAWDTIKRFQNKAACKWGQTT